MKQLILLFLMLSILFACNSNTDESVNKQPIEKENKQIEEEELDADEPSENIFSLLSPKKTGLHFRNDLFEDVYTIYNVMAYEYYFNGGGVAIGDINNDGLKDIFLTANTSENKLFLNKGNLQFEDISERAGIKQKGWSTGVTMADVNEDGYLDIYVCQGGPERDPSHINRKNLLFINQKDLSFKESAADYGLNIGELSTQAAFFDFDKDGDLDVYVMNESKYARKPLYEVFADIEDKEKLRAASGKMMRNDKGKFTDITEAAGMLKFGYGLGLVVSDINKDGWLDVYVANDYSVPDFMYINQKNGKFKDEVKERTKQLPWFAMGVDIADINNDGHQEVAVVDMATSDHLRGKTLMEPMNGELFYYLIDKMDYQRQHMFNVFQVNNGDGKFSNRASLLNVLSTEWSWAALLADFNNDGYKDYFVSNGYKRYVRDNDFRIYLKEMEAKHGGFPAEIRQEVYDKIPQVKLPNKIYKNIGGTFKDASKSWGVDQASYSNGAAYADLDNDGDLDLVVNNIDEYAYLYQNNSTNNYLNIKLESENHKEGTEVNIQYDDQIQMSEYGAVRGFQSHVADNLHFGLGDKEKIEELTVYWPSGKKQTLTDIAVNQTLTLKEKEAKKGNRNKKANGEKIFEEKSSVLNYTHTENEYNDYDTEVLLPYKQSTLGPFIASGDVNGDQLDDFYIGGAKDATGALFTQKPNGSFEKSTTAFQTHQSSEDLGAHFFDADQDGDLDLYVVSGGNEFRENDPRLRDRLYTNDGKGNFQLANNAIPDLRISGSRVKSADFDNDGDLDLLLAGRLIPKQYPFPPKSTLLKNEGGKFIDVTDEWASEFNDLGLVNDFVWTDLNNDNKPDLVVLGEWMPISVFINSGNSFENKTNQFLDKDYKGWWNRIIQKDIDNDGDNDFIVGNLGLNSKFHASDKKPLGILSNDFDKNGVNDVVLTKKYKGERVPVRGRECSSEQMPFIAEKFPTYEGFANANIYDILGQESTKEAIDLQVNHFESGLLINNNGKFTFQVLPIEAQAFPINGIIAEDINKDNHIDLILAGNIFNMEIETPRLDSGDGLVLLGDGQNNFKAQGISETGFYTPKDVKDLRLLKANGKSKYIVVANNNSEAQIFTFK